MKLYLKYLLSLFVLGTLFLSGCDKDDDDDAIINSPTVTINSVTPDPAFQGDEVTISGDNYQTVKAVFVGLREADFTVSGGSLTLVVPVDATPGPNEITLAMSNRYRVTKPLEVVLRPSPKVTSYDAFVDIGSDLVIKGLNFQYDPVVVTIGEVQATIKSKTDTEMTVVVPGGIPDNAPLEIVVTTGKGETVIPTAFIARTSVIPNSQLNGDADDFTGWTKLNGGARLTAVNGAAAYGGGRSMMVSPASGNPWDNQFASTPVPLVFGEEYSVIIWAKAVEPGAFFRVSCSQYDGNGADYFYGADQELSSNWEPYTWTFTVGKDLPTHRLVLDMGATTKPFMVDHIALVRGALGEVTGEKPNLLGNGGFEDGLTNWAALNGAFSNSNDARCGSSSLTATGVGGNPWSVQFASDPVVLEVDKKYELSFWAKAAGPDGTMRASCSQFASGQSDDFFYTPLFTVAQNWTNYSFVFTAKATSTGNHRIVLDFGSSTQTFFLDDISLKEYVAKESVYANGDFENGLANWSVLNGVLETTSTDVYEGSSALTATGAGGNPWDVQLASDRLALEVGKDYKVSFWAKAAGPDGVMRISCSQFASGQSDDFFYSPNITVAESWTYYAFIFNAKATSTGDHRIVLDFGSTTQKFFLDDLRVFQVDTSCE